jgi:hypothetical protein
MLTSNNLFCFVDWLNPQPSFIAVLSTSDLKNLAPVNFLCHCAYIAGSQTVVGFGEIIHFGIWLHRRKVCKALFHDIFSFCYENLCINYLTSLNTKAIFMSYVVAERQCLSLWG